MAERFRQVGPMKCYILPISLKTKESDSTCYSGINDFRWTLSPNMSV